MAVKTAKTYTVEELKEKAKLAAAVPRLVEIVRNAPLEESGKMNLTAVRDRAHQYILEQTGDIKDAKKLADSSRFLAMLRRDHAEEFKKLISFPEPKEEKIVKNIKKVNSSLDSYWFKIPDYAELHTIEFLGQRCHHIRFRQEFPGDYQDYPAALAFCMEILDVLAESSHQQGVGGPQKLINTLTKSLEENFGLKVKTCRNCEYCHEAYTDPIISKLGHIIGYKLYCRNIELPENKDCRIVGEADGTPVGNDGYWSPCYYKFWAPKEVSEKPSSA